MEKGSLPPLRAFLVVLAATVVTLLLLVGLNLAVDPYGVRPENAILKLPLKSRKAIEKNEYLYKAYSIANTHPETVYFGSSRVCLGLPADDALWHSKTYNCGLTAAEPEEILAYLRHALSLGSVKRVVFGMDAFAYLGPHVPPPTFDPGMLLTHPGGRMRPAVFSPGIFSLGAVMDSVRTILRQRGSDVVNYPKGVRDTDSIRRDIQDDSEWASQRVLAIARVKLGAATALDPKTDSIRVENARTIAALCRENGVEVIVVFLPIHQRYLELLEAKGLTQRVDHVREEVTAAFESAGLSKLAIHDFSHGQPHALDSQPESEGSKVWKWWWETSHFRAEFGREIVEAIARTSLNQTTPVVSAPPASEAPKHLPQ